jgi:hypothetical protein
MASTVTDFARNEKSHGVDYGASSLPRRVPADQYLVPDRLAFPGIGHDEKRRTARQQELFDRQVVRKAMQFWMPDDDQIGTECDADRLLCAVVPTDWAKLSRNIQSGAHSSEVLVHPIRGGFGVGIELASIGGDLFERLMAARVRHRRRQHHSLEDHIHTDEMGAPALGQGGCVSRPLLAGWTGIEEDCDCLGTKGHA